MSSTQLKNVWLILSLLLLGLNHSHAALHGRDLDGIIGADAVFDDTSDILWLLDTDLMSGPMGSGAATGAEDLIYGGLADWRFPFVAEFDKLKNQLGTQGSPGTNWGPFQNVQEYYYTLSLTPGYGGAWMNIKYSPAGHTFDWREGTPDIYAWAVRRGDHGFAATIPEPSVMGLLIGGFAAMFASKHCSARRSKSLRSLPEN